MTSEDTNSGGRIRRLVTSRIITFRVNGGSVVSCETSDPTGVQHWDVKHVNVLPALGK